MKSDIETNQHFKEILNCKNLPELRSEEVQEVLGWVAVDITCRYYRTVHDCDYIVHRQLVLQIP